MTRLTLVLAAWISLISAAPASLTPRKDRPPLSPDAPRVQAPRLSAEPVGRGTASEFLVTEQTEVLLDGKACRYRDVPSRATILRMEVAPDGKTVLRILFRAGK
jgi:hypothetical protein